MRSTLTPLVLLALPALFACKDPPQPLFDETGVWAVEKYALDGGILQDVPQERKNGFLFNYDSEAGLLAVASCFSADNQTIESAICQSNPNAAYWECQCFAYEFEESRMVWQPFDPGAVPPPVGDPLIEGSGAFEVLVETFPELGRSYQYNPVPMGVFNSDGMLSKYVLQQKALTVWEGDDVVAMASLAECSAACFGPE